jgi:hypothetical protein
MRWRRRIICGAVLAMAIIGASTSPGAARLEAEALVARPTVIDFHRKHVGTENYKRTRITNTSGADVRLVVTAGLPDDFGFGLLPGQTCPVFAPGEVVAAGASCYAVVRFSPTEGFIGWKAVGSLTATATDVVSGAFVAELSVSVLGEAVP